MLDATGRSFAMKRLHVHIAVDDLATSVRFYSTLFAAAPDVLKGDYAKWMLDDPRVNFAISARGARPGVEHLGIQVEDEAGLSEVYERLSRAEAPVLEEGTTTCCYAQSEKSWITDPAGVPWEVFRTFGESAVYGDGARTSGGRLATAAGRPVEAAPKAACCAPTAVAEPKAAAKACC
jgi:catechol 2,3-dioxygenase-like lactoylglutathione lyase family enzyme